MLLVKLYTSNGGYVTSAMIPPFNKYPDVLIWGERIFKFERAIPSDDPPHWGRYLEAFSFFVLPQLEVHDADKNKIEESKKKE